MKKQPTTVDEWIEAKLKYPKSYTVSPEGFLIAPPSAPGDVERQIPLNSRRNAAASTIQANFVKRKEDIAAAEAAATEARRTLQKVHDAYKRGEASAGEVVIANEEARAAEAGVIEKAVAPREVDAIQPDPEVRMLLLDNPYLVNKVADTAFQLRRATFPWTFFYETIIAEGEPTADVGTVAQAQPVAEEVQEDAAAKAKQGVIIAARKKKRLILPPA